MIEIRKAELHLEENKTSYSGERILKLEAYIETAIKCAREGYVYATINMTTKELENVLDKLAEGLSEITTFKIYAH